MSIASHQPSRLWAASSTDPAAQAEYVALREALKSTSTTPTHRSDATKVAKYTYSDTKCDPIIVKDQTEARQHIVNHLQSQGNDENRLAGVLPLAITIQHCDYIRWSSKHHRTGQVGLEFLGYTAIETHMSLHLDGNFATPYMAFLNAIESWYHTNMGFTHWEHRGCRDQMILELTVELPSGEKRRITENGWDVILPLLVTGHQRYPENFPATVTARFTCPFSYGSQKW